MARRFGLPAARVILLIPSGLPAIYQSLRERRDRAVNKLGTLKAMCFWDQLQSGTLQLVRLQLVQLPLLADIWPSNLLKVSWLRTNL